MSLADIRSPQDLANLSLADLNNLAAEIRTLLVESVAQTGGHLGSNLGIVELTIALHRVFNIDLDRIVFDTGHQAYVHKILTGRAGQFSTLRQAGGLSGYPSRAESSADIVENSHASTALSWAEGIALGNLKLAKSGHVVAVVGDGSLTGGMAWEAINSIANKSDLPLVIVVNDNGRSYSPTTGGLAKHLDAIRTSSQYEGLLSWGKRTLDGKPFGSLIYRILHAFKRGIADATQTRGMFQDLGIKYIGPVAGHSLEELETALRRARDLRKPVLVHCLTEKGRGYEPAELDELEKFHGVGKFDKETGIIHSNAGPTWTELFRKTIVELASQDERVVGITAAMLGPTGLDKFAQKYPERVFDVGIAEQHAITSAAGMSFAGLKPVLAIYASFLNRAFDQLLLDAALHNERLAIVLDRAGVTGDDGPSHNGVWDLSLVAMIPNATLYAPWDEISMLTALKEAVQAEVGVKVVRFPKGALPAVLSDTPVSILSQGNPDARVKLVAIGAFAHLGLGVMDELKSRGIEAELIVPLQVFPLGSDLLSRLKDAEFIVSLEDGIRVGGFGSALALQVPQRVEIFGVIDGFPAAAPRAKVLEASGLTAEKIAEKISTQFHK